MIEENLIDKHAFRNKLCVYGFMNYVINLPKFSERASREEGPRPQKFRRLSCRYRYSKKTCQSIKFA